MPRFSPHVQLPAHRQLSFPGRVAAGEGVCLWLWLCGLVVYPQPSISML